MAPSVADIIAGAKQSGEYANIKEFAGKTLTFVDFVRKDGKNGEYLQIEALDGDEEVKIQTGAAQVVEILKGLKVADLLPVELQVESFKTANGTGYSLEEVEA